MTDKQSIALRLVEVSHDKWAAYSDTGQLLIICRDRRIAERYASSILSYDSKEPHPPTHQSEDE